ncbi:receptor-type tyrosine-protein phosphatase eta-like [Rana temporaria]|uniref:receptor-type tyrosine-protein phosphatase eta-like n=1 Tax=Rana temporaria TaxID=8407 RepID=UPI001AAC4779|nr:receptor-type tyrosine-protein phosphatase eta-like [Rana temporaria]
MLLISNNQLIMCLLIVPGIVQSVKTENITSTSLSLSWEKPDGNASSYFIHILEDPTFNKTINIPSYIIEGLTPGNYYTFIVFAQVGENHVQGDNINFPVQTSK